jgi:hypothetical protein
MLQAERVTYSQWDSYSRRVFRKRVKEHGHSLAPAAISRRVSDFIVELQPDTKTMLVRPGWREAMQEG